MKHCIFEKKRTIGAITCKRDESVRIKGCYKRCPFYKKTLWQKLFGKG